MAINLTNTSSLLNTGSNLMDNETVSPSTNLLGARSPADVSPNEDQVMAEVASTEVAGEPQGVPTTPEEPAPQPKEQSPVPEEDPMVQTMDTGVTPAPQTPELPPVALPGTVEEVDNKDPFADSLEKISFGLPEAPDQAFDGSLDVSKEFMDEDQSTWETFKKSSVQGLYNLNKIGYGGVKGIAGLADVATAPGWALGYAVAGGETFPFSKMLEQHYPEKNYQFEEDPDTIADELMRFAQTGAEFVGPGVLTNVGAKIATKGAYLPTMAEDAFLSGMAALGYQGALEMGADDTTALLTAFLAPSSPQALKAFYKMSFKGAYISTVKPTVWAFSKVTGFSPIAGLLKSTVKGTVSDRLQVTKGQLQQDPEMWTQSPWHRKAREIVLSTPDKVKSIEEQKAEINSIKRWLNQAIPRSPEMDEHVVRMKSLEDNINAELPEGQKISFTLEQIYSPILKKNGMDDGIKEVMASLRLVNGQAYDDQLKKNQEALYAYLEKKKGQLGPEETKAFTDIFDTHMDEIIQVQENIYAISNNEPLINQAKSVGYEFSDQPMAEELRPAAEEIRGLLGKAYDSMLDNMPKDVELDTTPLKEAVLDVYDSLGIFADPKSMPSYLKDIVKALTVNADDGTIDAYTSLKNQASEVGIELNKINREIRELSQQHKKALADFDADDTEGMSKLKASQEEEMVAIQGRHSDLLQRQKELDIEKRTSKQQKAGEGVEDLPEPNLVNVGDIREGLRVINSKMRDAYKANDFDKYEVLRKLHVGLTDSMAGLKEVDEAAYNLFETTNKHYTRFVATDFNESMAHTITEKGDHLFRITSDQAVNTIWENGDRESMERFLRNFDGTRKGLTDYLDNIDVPEGTDVRPIDAYSEQAERGVNALKDIVYTSLARQINRIDMDPEIDPAVRMERIKVLLGDFYAKHKSKLDQIPGLENIAGDVTATIKNLAGYRQALQQLEDRKKLSILRDVVGPGKKASQIMNNRKVAEEMYDFLTNKLPKIDADGSGNLQVAQAEANAIRRTLRQGFLNEHTKNGVIDYKALDRLLATGSSTRNNLSLVLGEQEILKLDAFRMLGKAMAEGETQFTEVLTSDKTLRSLEKLGLPLGRIGSILQRRAIFTPSGGYLAGAIASKVLNSMGNINTSRTMQLLVERPFDVLNLDQILLNEMRRLDGHKASQLKKVMEGGMSHMRELASWLPKQMAKHVQAHVAYLGYQVSETEVTQMIEDVLYNDPRHPEFFEEEEQEETQEQQIIQEEVEEDSTKD